MCRNHTADRQLGERLPESRRLLELVETLHGVDPQAVDLNRERQARPCGTTVDEHRARPTHPVLAAQMRSGQPSSSRRKSASVSRGGTDRRTGLPFTVTEMATGWGVSAAVTPCSPPDVTRRWAAVSASVSAAAHNRRA